jgi:signal transduction histidine kinase
MNRSGLRVRVAAAVAITCFAVVAALALTLYTASEDLEETLVDQIVNEEMEFLVRSHFERPSIAREPGPNLQYYILHSEEERQRLPEKLRALPPGSHEIGQGSDELHVSVRDIDGTRFIVAYDAGPHEVREQQFQRLVLFALATVMVAAAGMGYWISGLITRQITDLASRVSELDPGASREPLVRPDQDAEVSALACALDQYEARIRDLIVREQEFTGNASHELRTPLTAIRTSCELLEAEPGLPERARLRIAGIAAAAARMTGQVEMLLLLARSQSTGTREDVAIAECVNDAVRPLSAEIARKGLTFENRVAAGASLRLNRQALDIVLTNFLRNAVAYTEQGHVLVSLDGSRLTVVDSGIGIEPARLSQIFGRFQRGDGHGEGFGLGLAIVKRICDHCGWHVEAESTPGRGSAFHVRLS